MHSPRRRIIKCKPTIGTPKAASKLAKKPPSARHAQKSKYSAFSTPSQAKASTNRRHVSHALRSKRFPLHSDSSNASSLNSSAASSLNSSRRLASSSSSRGDSSQTPRRETPLEDYIALFEGMQLPMTPAIALKHFAAKLTSHEQAEILDYPEIYCLGLKATKVKTRSNAMNSGFDDDRGDYRLVVGDHIAYRFEVLERLGTGSFGQVCRCFDYKRKEFVALKVIRNKRRFHRQAAVEVKILDLVRTHDREDAANIVQMKSYFLFRKHLCITFEVLSMNLYELMKSNGFKGFSLGLVRRFAVQVLDALSFNRKLSIIHCDLKPENILLKQPNHSGIKVIDYGSSCLESEQLYTYIQSRFYRAPEIILGLEYTVAIDMWSFGCLLAELATGYPLFPGEDETEQLLCIMEVLGLPPHELLEKGTKTSKFFDADHKPRLVPNRRGRVRSPSSRSLTEKLKCTNDAFLSLLAQCLEWDAEKRITPDEALQHVWVTEAVASAVRPSISKGIAC